MAGQLLTISNRHLAQLNQFADSAYGVKNGYGKSGGLGVMMMDAGTVVKAKTRWYENLFSTTKNMEYQQKTQELRKALGSIIAGIRDSADNKGVPPETKAALTNILAELGLNKSGNVQASFSKKLLSRRTVAKVLNKLDELSGANGKDDKEKSVWGKADTNAFSLGKYPSLPGEAGAEFDRSDLSAQHTKKTEKDGYVTKKTLVGSLDSVGRYGAAKDDVVTFEKFVSPKIVEGLSQLVQAGKRTPLVVGDDLKTKIRTSLNKFFSGYRLGIRDKTDGLNMNPNRWQRRWNDVIGSEENKEQIKAMLLSEPDLNRVFEYLRRMMAKACGEAYKSGMTGADLPFGEHKGDNFDWGLSPFRRAGDTPKTFLECLPKMVSKVVGDVNELGYVAPSPFVAPEEPPVAPKEQKVAPKEPPVAPEEPPVAPKEQKVAPKEQKVKPPIVIDAAMADEIAGELARTFKHEQNPEWSKGFAAWTLRAFMKDAETNIAEAFRKLNPDIEFTPEEQQKLQAGYERQKEGWASNNPLWHTLLFESELQLGRNPKPALKEIRSEQANVLLKFFRDASDAFRMQSVQKDSKMPELKGQTAEGNTCSIIATLNAMLVSGPTTKATALAIMNPKMDGTRSYYEFPVGKNAVRVYTDELEKFPADLLPEKVDHNRRETSDRIWQRLSDFEKAALIALNRNVSKTDRVMPGEPTDYYPVAALFGINVREVGSLSGSVPKGEFELHAAEVARALQANKTCVLRMPGHFVALTGVTFDEKHMPSFSYVESSGGPRNARIGLNALQNGYQLYIQDDSGL